MIAAPDSNSAAGGIAPIAAQGGSGPFVLLVDDERAFADALAFRLQARGIPCVTVYRGEEALRHLDNAELETVLLDLNMPGIHGLELLREIKAARPEVEVILLTGEADIASAAKGMRRGAGDYLLKPVKMDDLLDSLAKAGRRGKEHRERLRAAEAGKLMALGSLAEGVGHEINNPLQIILQHSELLEELLQEAKDGAPDLTAMSRSAAIIRAKARRAGEITAQLLDLAGKTRSGKAKCDVRGLAERVLARFEARAKEEGVRILLDIADDIPALSVSPAELDPLLAHLVRNALDAISAVNAVRSVQAGRKGLEQHTHDQFLHTGEVRISARRVISGDEGGGEAVRIQVADNGEGIAPANAPHIYEPFFSTRPVGKGTGLGLTVCHSIVSALRGNLEMTALKPHGACFTVTIPLI